MADVKTERWDVIIAGSSFAAMFFLRDLPKGLRILILEKGQIQDHADQLIRDIHVEEAIPIDNQSGYAKNWKAHTVFGGNSNCWWACTPRFLPSDFALNSTFGVGMDWPLGYHDLEPLYGEVEAVMEIAGGGSDHLMPRSSPFPYPPHIPSRSDVALQAYSKNWFAQSAARANGGSRATCCANGICNLCPVDAKFSVLNGIEHFERDRATLVLGADVREIISAAGTATGVMVRDVDGSEHEIAGDLIALGTNAIFNAAILLRSGFSHAALGRYLHEQVAVVALIDTGPGQVNFFGGTSIPGHGYDLYDGDHRAKHGAVLMENHNAPAPIRAERGRWSERVKIKLIAEDLPQAKNRVVLTDNEAKTEWLGHSAYGLDALDWAVKRLPDVVPFDVENIQVGARLISEDHIQGTHRMGADPKSSVTDANLKVHGVSNVYALGAGAFPSGPPANPTLTLSALSIRAARSL